MIDYIIFSEEQDGNADMTVFLSKSTDFEIVGQEFISLRYLRSIKGFKKPIPLSFCVELGNTKTNIKEIKKLPFEGLINFDSNSEEEIIFHTDWANGLGYKLHVNCINEGSGSDPDYFEGTKIELISFKNPKGEEVKLSNEEEKELLNYIQEL